MKRILSLFLAVLMIVSILPTSAFAAGNEPGPGIYDVPILNLESKAPIQSVKEQFKTGFGTSMRVVIEENGTKTAELTPRPMTVDYMGRAVRCNITAVEGAVPSEHRNDMPYDYKTGSTIFNTKWHVGTSSVPDYWNLRLPGMDGKGKYPLRLKIDYMTVSMGKGFMDITLTPDWNHAVRDNAAEAAPVIAKISAIGTVTLQSGAAIEAARAAYDALVPESRNAVTNYSTLTAAEDQLAALQAQDTLDRENAAKVDAQIQALEPVTLDSEAAITAAREAYEALNDPMSPPSIP